MCQITSQNTDIILKSIKP